MNNTRFQLVTPSELPEPPYPADVRAKGWGFTLDIERIRQSDAWVGCKPHDLRNPMLRLWMESWTQVPCGSLPSNDELLADHIDMDPKMFRACRDVLLHGWYQAKDGRLYHRVITALVEQMRDLRKADRERKARDRAAVSDRIPPDSAGLRRSPPLEVEVTEGNLNLPPSTPAAQELANAADAPYRPPPTPTAEIVSLYHENLPTLRHVEILSEQRKRALAARWRQVCASEQFTRQQGLDWFNWFFRRVAESAFLMGRTRGKRDGQPFFGCCLDWLMRPENFVKVCEGVYLDAKR